MSTLARRAGVGIVKRASFIEEIRKLNQQTGAHKFDSSGVDVLKNRLDLLRHKNLEHGSFAEKLDMMGLLDIKVYPSEDLKSMRIRTGLDIGANEASNTGQNNCGKVLFAPPYCTIGRTGIFSSS